MNTTKLLFIVNPVSGIGKKGIIEEKINLLTANYPNIEIDIQYTRHRGHAVSIAENNKYNYSTIVAVGGDGSVNEVACGLKNSNCKLGIIPAGSGNGFARSIGIPIDTDKALEIINRGNCSTCDLLQVNDIYSINIAGVGLDAYIAHCFDKYGKRGLVSYLKIIFREFFSYKAKPYTIHCNNNTYNVKALTIAIANSTQYGNNAYISPLSDCNDGKFELVILSQPPLWAVPKLLIQLFRKKIYQSKYIQTLSAQKAEINLTENIAHYDGEPFHCSNNLIISIHPKCLTIIKP